MSEQGGDSLAHAPGQVPETAPATGVPSSNLLGPQEVRELAERLGVSPTKKLGQNFVIDPNTVRKIVRLADVTAGDRIIEVGPGLGSLTLGLTEIGADVTAVEIDARLAEELPATLKAMQPEAVSQLRVIHSDALALDGAHLASLPHRPDVLVANLPYNVSVPIIMHLLALIPGAEGSTGLRRGLIMVQAEVGHRIAAEPGSKEYGAPSAKAAWYGTWRVAGTVSRRIFWPVPGVDSVLVGYERCDEPLGSEAERELTFELVNAAFAQRRKMLRQSLQTVAGVAGSAEAASAMLTSAGIDATARAEELPITAFLAIARQLLASR